MSSCQPIAKQMSKVSTGLIAALIILAVLATASTMLVRSIFIDYRATARTTLNAGDVLEDIFEARMAALKWRLAANTEHIEEFNGNIEELSTAKQDLTSHSALDDVAFAAVAEIDQQLVEYQASFERMLTARSQYDTVEANVRAAGLSARKALTEIMVTAYEALGLEELEASTREILRVNYPGS